MRDGSAAWSYGWDIFGTQFGVGNTMGVDPRRSTARGVCHDLRFSAPLSDAGGGMAVFKTNYKESYKYSFVPDGHFPCDLQPGVAVVGAIIFY